jgi:hypothetical protein
MKRAQSAIHGPQDKQQHRLLYTYKPKHKDPTCQLQTAYSAILCACEPQKEAGALATAQRAACQCLPLLYQH